MLPKGSISRIREYYLNTPKFKAMVLRALREFFDRPDLNQGGSLATTQESEGFFNEWFLYDFDLGDGQSVLENFVATNPLKLDSTDMELYLKLLNNKYGVFEVLDIKLGKSIKLKDLQTNKQWLVKEYNATFNLKNGSIFFARIGKVGDYYELIGADSFSFQGINNMIKKSFRDLPIKLTPKIAYEILQKTNTENPSNEYLA